MLGLLSVLFHDHVKLASGCIQESITGGGWCSHDLDTGIVYSDLAFEIVKVSASASGGAVLDFDPFREVKEPPVDQPVHS